MNVSPLREHLLLTVIWSVIWSEYEVCTKHMYIPLRHIPDTYPLAIQTARTFLPKQHWHSVQRICPISFAIEVLCLIVYMPQYTHQPFRTRSWKVYSEYLLCVVPRRRVPGPLLPGRRVGHHLALPRQPLRRGAAVREVVLDAPRVPLVLSAGVGVSFRGKPSRGVASVSPPSNSSEIQHTSSSGCVRWHVHTYVREVLGVFDTYVRNTQKNRASST